MPLPGMVARKKRNLLVTYLLVMTVSNPLLVAAFTLMFGHRGAFWRQMAVSLTIAEIVTTCCMGAAASLGLGKRWWARRTGKPVAPGKALYFVLALAVMPGGLWLAFRVTELLAVWLGFEFRAPLLSEARFSLVLGTILAGVAFLWQLRSEARSATQEALIKLKDAQLSALTAQMNPHLLFNALNTVAALIRTDPDRAEETVVRLADLYRGVLAATRLNTHSLTAELAICDAYLAVERARFGDRLRVSVRTEGDLSVEVPALILQPLVENAVTHGLLGKAAGGTLSIEVTVGSTISLVVSDDGVGMGHSTRSGNGAGIAVLKERLQLAYGDLATLRHLSSDGGGTRVELTLPIS